MKKVLCVVIIALFLFSPCIKETFAQGKPKAPLQERVDKAIDKGLDYLKDKFKGKDFKGEDSELVLFTFLHAGLTKKDAIVKKAARDLMGKKLGRTYNVALLAMALEALDPMEYQDKIAECAQFLVDSQCPNGQWSYECPGWKTDAKSGTRKKAAVASGGDKEEPAIGRVEIKANPQQTLPDGDNSNTQYALLGLRSAYNSNIMIPKETMEKAAQFLSSRQMADGGWCYSVTGASDDYSYGSMSTAGLGGLCISRFYLGIDLQKDGTIQKGSEWFAKNFKVDANPGADTANSIKLRVESNLGQGMVLYYYLYGLERVGVFLSTEKFGDHEWYNEGAEFLLGQQDKKEGKWGNGTLETCFAILFLKRATAPLKAVESGLDTREPVPQDK
ncbi:MAG: terpene cyclase/mutase family protein [Planctomycetes bacterium]|nr:terpene cyclase/mutase family protein [Planctomycetota bacterium]